MSILVTGSAGHLGEALVRTLRAKGVEVIGTDIKASPYTNFVGSIADKEFVKSIMPRVTVVYHAATLHKPHVATHSKTAFIETNVLGALNLLEAAVEEGVSSFVFTSTTSAFGDALRPSLESPAAWVTEETAPIPRNIYGVTKLSAEELCHLFSRKHALNCIVLRTSRFFPEDDDDKARRDEFEDANLKLNELLYRRADIEDMVSAHLLAANKASLLGFRRFIISSTPPFKRSDVLRLRTDLPSVMDAVFPEWRDIYKAKNWQMLQGLDRVYDNSAARSDLGWEPKYTFEYCLQQIAQSKPWRSGLSELVGSKGYHSEVFEDGPYPV